jgi:UDP-N-acetylglucosamine transferase subunit ALG13
MREEPDLLNEPVAGRHLLVATTGGHLAQLVKWSHIIGSDPNSLWVTFRSPQSESLLHGRRVLHVPYVGSRDVIRAARVFVQIMKDIDWRKEAFTSAVSTGAAVGIVGLAAAQLHRVPAFYFETVARVDGPTLSGKMASLSPWIQTYCQYESWANRRWKYRRSLIENYSKVSRTPNPQPRLFITLGTNKTYRFDALVDAVLATGLANEETVWQLGITTRQGLPGTATVQLGSSEFEQCARDADVVITHAGVGTLMNLFDMGIYPVVVPRRAKRREVVDDHQLQIAGLLQSRGISLVTDPEQLTCDMLIEASANAVENVPSAF